MPLLMKKTTSTTIRASTKKTISAKESSKKMSTKAYIVPNPAMPNKAVEFDPAVCIGSNMCVNICPTNVMIHTPVMWWFA
jgi:formate hydrogenlyase subunit 6/NADH:ubiquinone oxidoreductase subunit I